MLFTFLLSQLRRGENSLIVCLAPSGCKNDLSRLSADHSRNLFSRLFENLLGFLPVWLEGFPQVSFIMSVILLIAASLIFVVAALSA